MNALTPLTLQLDLFDQKGVARRTAAGLVVTCRDCGRGYIFRKASKLKTSKRWKVGADGLVRCRRCHSGRT